MKKDKLINSVEEGLSLYEDELDSLTLDDFQEENFDEIPRSNISPETAKKLFEEDKHPPATKYKYTPIEVESIFELKEPLEEGKLFYGKPDNMKKILHEWGLMKVIVEDEFRIHLLEEVSWQEQLCEEWSDFTTNSESIHYKGSMAKEDLILFAKRVVELSGELK